MTERNAAAELHDLLSSWQTTPTGVAVRNHRAGDGGNWWEQELRAIDLLEEVTREVRGRNTLRRFEQTLEALRDGIFSVSHAMASVHNGSIIHFSEKDLGLLEALQLVPTTAPAVVRGESVEELLAVAREASALVAAADWLDEDAKRYLLDLTTNLEVAIRKVSDRGGAEVRRLANELAGALSAYFGEAEDKDQREKAYNLVGRTGLAIRKLTWIGVGAVIESGVEQGVQAISGG